MDYSELIEIVIVYFIEIILECRYVLKIMNHYPDSSSTAT